MEKLFTLILVVLAIVLIVLWIFLPFAVFKLKELARELLSEQRETNRLLQKITDHNSRQS